VKKESAPKQKTKPVRVAPQQVSVLEQVELAIQTTGKKIKHN